MCEVVKGLEVFSVFGWKGVDMGVLEVWYNINVVVIFFFVFLGMGRIVRLILWCFCGFV